jgi:hypothetical protein
LYDAASNDEPQLREFIRILSRKEQQLQEQLDDIRVNGRNQPDPQPVRKGTGQTGIINTVAGQASLSGRNTQMQQQESIVIVGMARTAMGGFQGMFASQTASQLGAAAIRAAVERAGVAAEDVDEVIMGCVLPAGQGQAPARRLHWVPGCRWRLAAPPSTRCAAPA